MHLLTWHRHVVVAATLAFATSVLAADVTVDLTTKYQTIDGFGFFGAMDDWWGNASNLISDAGRPRC